MEEINKRTKPALSAEELEQVAGGAAWNDDIEFVRKMCNLVENSQIYQA